MEDVNCNFHCTFAYCFLDEISLANTWSDDKQFNVQYMLQVMDF